MLKRAKRILCQRFGEELAHCRTDKLSVKNVRRRTGTSDTQIRTHAAIAQTGIKATRKNEWKEIDFMKDCLEKPCEDWLEAEGKKWDNKGLKKRKYHFEKQKVVRFFLKT